jgi:hypothetical protein
MGAPGWERDLERWLEPFLVRLSRQAQRRWAPVYLQGLLLPGERKSVEPMAHRVAPGDVPQLHHFVSTAPWATAPLEDELVRQAERLVGGPDAVLVIDDTALVKRANCQALVSLTLAPRWPSRQAPGALASSGQRDQVDRHAATAGVSPHHLAARDEGPAHGGLRGHPGAGRRWPPDDAQPPSAGSDGVAGV